MLRIPTLVAGASLSLSVPSAAQVGLSSGPGSITLSATHLSSVGVMVPGVVSPALSLSLVAGTTGRLTLTSSWNVDPAQPVRVTLAAFVEGSADSLDAALAGAASSGSQVPASIGGPLPALPTDRVQPYRGGEELSPFARTVAPLVGRGGRTDHVQVGSSGTLTVVAITQ
jgi:hypothetical protein